MDRFERAYQHYRQLVDRRLRHCVKAAPPHTLYDPAAYVLSGGGKRIRPLLVLLSCRAVGGAIGKALPAAVAIEILHNFTLVHDDIMDHAKSRRGRPTVHTRWDTNVAILVGDELVAIAYRELLKTDSASIGRVAQIFTEGVVEVCEGQAYDKEFELRKKVSLRDYLLMIGKKTGKMVAVASEIGAVIGGGTAAEVRALRAYGEEIGRAFQIQDDLLDIVADEKVFGKAIGGDIVEGKKTYLLLKAYERANNADRAVLRRVIERRTAPKNIVPTVRDIYRRTGVIDLAQSVVARHIATANRRLSVLPHGDARGMLFWLSDMLLRRKF